MSICVFNIETNGLEADKGQMLFACVYDPAKRKTFSFRTWNCFHRRLASLEAGAIRKLLHTLTRYDVVVSYYGTRFDIPFLKTRSVRYGRRVPKLPTHVDLYYLVRHHLRLSSNSLANVTRLMRAKESKLRLPREALDQSRFVPVSLQRALQRRCAGDTRLTWHVAETLARTLTSEGPVFKVLQREVRELAKRKPRNNKRLGFSE